MRAASNATPGDGLQGHLPYEIDLTTAQASLLRSAIDPYASHARQVGRSGSSRTGRSRRAGTSDHDANSVRAWAAARSVDISQRGRISKDVLEEFRTAGN